MLIALNQLRRRYRQRLAAVVLALALCCLLVAAHSALAERHMGGDMAVCLGVAQTAALALSIAVAMVAATRQTLPCPSWDRSLALTPARVARRRPVPRSRAGPAVLQVFRR
jgi:hypothetical protein